MARHWTKRILLIVGFLFAILMVWHGVRQGATLARSWATARYIRTLPPPASPVAVTQAFDPSKSKPVQLVAGSLEGPPEVISSLYPYHRLVAHQVTAERCMVVGNRDSTVDSSTQGRYYLVDQFWSVYWIEIVTCFAPAAYYGPFRL